ncbi:MAG: hypothetical protein IT223_12560 [Crocinitomicaceae bacterium]|nr:hypothetical protein [Crocinitomicaceae bacterium]
MNISRVTSSSQEDQWIHLPFLIYKDDANWIPHLRQDIKAVFNPSKNKYFREGEAIRWILTDTTGTAIGRTAAFIHPKFSSGQKYKVGGLGFFECTDNDTAARKLLDTACEWLKEKGMDTVDGPINFGERDTFWGLLTENFTDMSSYRMNYNPPYYQKFFEAAGFRIYFEQICFKRDLNIPAQEVFVRKTNMLMSEPGYSISSARGKSIEKISEDFLTIYNNAWGGFAGFKKMQRRQAHSIVKSIKPVMDPDIMVFVYHHEKPIAFYINLPELNEIFRHLNGNLNWWGKMLFLYYKLFAKRNTMVGIIFGVDCDYHGKGVEGAMIKWAEENIVTLKRYNNTILTWIGDFNPKMLHIAENLGAYPYRKLATYRKHFDSSVPFERCPLVS